MVQRVAATESPAALRVLSERLARTDDHTRQMELLEGITRIVKK
jgi:hypothetical protein